MIFSRLFSAFLILAFTAGLTSCGGKLGLTNWSERKSFRSFQQTLAEPDSPALAPVEDLLKNAAKLSKNSPGQAIDLYLEAAERTVAGSTKGGDEAKIYRHAVGHAVALLNARTTGAVNAKPVRYKVSYVRGRDLFDPAKFDTITFADSSEAKNVDVRKREGIGAPMLCTIDFSEEHKKEHPFIHKIGIDSSATALVTFPSSGSVRISLYNSRRVVRTSFRGVTRPLAANFTTPLIASLLRQDAKGLGWKGIIKPAEFINEMGLYSTELIDPTKIPVVFTHGLGSKPATWVKPYNALLGEEFFRQNYQVFAFYYPTGLPPVYPASGLRQGLDRMHRELKRRGAGRNADRVVMVGHSMGGLMTSFTVRDFRGTSDELFTSPIKELPVSEDSRKALATMLETAPPRFVKRAVFVATPHRGSEIADNWLGRLGSKLIKLPQQILTLQIPEMTQSLTSLGQNITGGDDPFDGVARLKAGNPVLTFVLERPVAYGIPYHSIIGDRGKGGGPNRGDKPESSDGVVPYWSSHLDGAVSEKIVPSHHNAQTNDEAIEEMKRIFRLHLGR